MTSTQAGTDSRPAASPVGGCHGAELVVAPEVVELGAAEAVAVAVEADGGGPATVELVELAGWEEAAVAESVGVVEGPGG